MRFKPTYLALAMLAGFGLALGACSSSSDEEAAPPGMTDMDSEPTAEDKRIAELEEEKRQAEEQAAAEKMRADAAQAELDRQQAAADLATARALLDILDADVSGEAPTVTVTATYGKSPRIGATLTVDGTATARDPAFSASDDGADTISGWAGYMYDREERDKSASGAMVVYTNIEAPKSRPFAEEYGEDLIVTFASDGVGMEARASAEEFAKSGLKNHGDDRSFAGTYDGAEGTFKCTSTCTSERDSNLKLVLSEDWTFTAKSGAMILEPDADHLHFGWWLRKNADGDPLWVHSFADGQAAFSGTLAEIRGAATYKGGAAGKYAIRSLGGTSGGGHWTAMSELTAKFGADDAGTVSGKIYNFMAGGEEMPWEVALGSAEIDADISGAATWKINGEPSKSSDTDATWSGGFYGSGIGTEGQPSGIAGTFDASFGAVGDGEDDHTGRMTGAFGATRQ